MRKESQAKAPPRLFSCRKRWVTSDPNATPTPRLLGARPVPECGSLHSSSHIKPDNHHHLLIGSKM